MSSRASDQDGQDGDIEPTLAQITLAKDYPHPARALSEVEADMWKALQEIAAPTAKAEILAALDRLPDDCTMEDIPRKAKVTRVN